MLPRGWRVGLPILLLLCRLLSALVQITLSSVKVRLALSVDDCFCASWNETLLKLFTIFYVSEGVCVLFPVSSLRVFTTGDLLFMNHKRPLRLETDPEVLNKMIVISKVVISKFVTILSFHINHKIADYAIPEDVSKSAP
jgi:hypothetical protein